jgi:hypothetical protein
MDAFKEWCHLLERVQHEITMYFDHKNLQYFMTACVLNRCQAQWALSFFQFWFIITYRQGRQQRKPDALFCHSYLMPKKGDAVYDQ